MRSFLPARSFWFYFSLMLLCLSALSGCSQPMDPALQTLITRATIDAFRNIPLIQNQRQAAIAALRAVGTSRLEYNQPPKVISVTRMSYQQAKKKIATKGEQDYTTGNYEVWLVIFEGEFRIVSFASKATPGAFGCNRVWVVIGFENDQGEGIKSAPCEN